ncbi:MAG: hypothetical protein HRU50_06100 [Winogradskyella sp.]|uniref:hypothetical protein n=1 Tax=Winogradskyella sp. TaxID=1883156 RepID=UPI0025EFB8C0|nr:hypothetical protein [Winogradskyella sp.]NRB59503.1 hypothetical protein [Winogradskyella sp.]
MSEKKNIDRLFQEKFKDFEVAPNDAIWNRINESLPNNEKKKRRVIPIWWQIAGVAASVVLLLNIGFSFFNSEENSSDTPVIVNTETENNSDTKKNENSTLDASNDRTKSSEELNNTSLVESDIHQNNEDKNTDSNDALTNTSSQPFNNSTKTLGLLTEDNSTNQTSKTLKSSVNELINGESTPKNTVAASDNTQSTEKTKNDLSSNEFINSELKKAIENNSSTVTEITNKGDNIKENSTIINEQKEVSTIEKEKESIESAIAENNNDDIIEKEKDDEPNRWSITPNVAPVYFASLGEGSPIHNQFNTNSKGSDINMSYGITGSYAISDRIKVRAGVNRVNLNYTTSGVYAFSGSDIIVASSDNASQSSQSQGNITLREGANVALMSSKVMNRASAPEVFNTKLTGDLDQRFGFIEIPLEIEYKLLDKKFGLNVVGGFSTFFLNENEIFADIDGTSTLIGEANNINNTSFSANFGLGLNYNVTKKWNINLEPQFKYQINTFNNTFGNFRPFFIGLYTGIIYKF